MDVANRPSFGLYRLREGRMEGELGNTYCVESVESNGSGNATKIYIVL